MISVDTTFVQPFAFAGRDVGFVETIFSGDGEKYTFKHTAL